MKANVNKRKTSAKKPTDSPEDYKKMFRALNLRYQSLNVKYSNLDTEYTKLQYSLIDAYEKIVDYQAQVQKLQEYQDNGWNKPPDEDLKPDTNFSSLN